MFLEASVPFLRLIQMESLGNGKSLEEDCSHMFTASCFRRVMTQIVPMLGKLNNGESCSALLEFVTESGKEELSCTWYKTRSIVLGVVHCKESSD